MRSHLGNSVAQWFPNRGLHGYVPEEAGEKEYTVMGFQCVPVAIGLANGVREGNMGLERVGEFASLVGHGCTVEERGGYMGSSVAYLGGTSHGPPPLWPKNSFGHGKTWFGHPLCESISDQRKFGLFYEILNTLLAKSNHEILNTRLGHIPPS